MRFHHGYIGAALIFWSLAVIGFRVPMIGEFNPWLAWGGLLLGVGLATHDVLLHLKHKRAR